MHVRVNEHDSPPLTLDRFCCVSPAGHHLQISHFHPDPEDCEKLSEFKTETSTVVWVNKLPVKLKRSGIYLNLWCKAYSNVFNYFYFAFVSFTDTFK